MYMYAMWSKLVFVQKLFHFVIDNSIKKRNGKKHVL